MKKFILGLLMFSTTAFPRGWFEFTMARYFEQGRLGPVWAAGMYEPLLLGISYSNWNGIGVNVRDNVWLTSKHDLEFDLQKNVTLSLGVALRHNDVNYGDVHAGIKVGLWE